MIVLLVYEKGAASRPLQITGHPARSAAEKFFRENWSDQFDAQYCDFQLYERPAQAERRPDVYWCCVVGPMNAGAHEAMGATIAGGVREKFFLANQRYPLAFVRGLIGADEAQKIAETLIGSEGRIPQPPPAIQPENWKAGQ